MACYKARGFLQKAESLGLTALGLGQRMFGLRGDARSPSQVPCVTSRLIEVGGPFCCTEPDRAMLAEAR